MLAIYFWLWDNLDEYAAVFVFFALIRKFSHLMFSCLCHSHLVIRINRKLMKFVELTAHFQNHSAASKNLFGLIAHLRQQVSQTIENSVKHDNCFNYQSFTLSALIRIIFCVWGYGLDNWKLFSTMIFLFYLESQKRPWKTFFETQFRTFSFSIPPKRASTPFGLQTRENTSKKDFIFWESSIDRIHQNLVLRVK